MKKRLQIPIGIAYCENGHGDEAIKIADTYMRDAKKSGKNTIRPELDDLPSILEKFAVKNTLCLIKKPALKRVFF